MRHPIDDKDDAVTAETSNDTSINICWYHESSTLAVHTLSIEQAQNLSRQLQNILPVV